MSDLIESTAAESPEDNAPVDEQADLTPPPEDIEPDDSKPGREAAKYRRQLRETEKERDSLTARVETMQRAEAERIAAKTLKVPSALWATGVSPADVLDQNGDVDPEKVAKVAKAAVDQLGLATPRPANYVPREGSNPTGGSSDRWADAFGQSN